MWPGLVAMLALVGAPSSSQDAATGTPEQTQFARQALGHLRQGETSELVKHLTERPYRASTLVHNLVRQSAMEGEGPWALGAARGIASALASSEIPAAAQRGTEALVQVEHYAALDAVQRTARIDFDALWMRVGDSMNSGDRIAAEAHAHAAAKSARAVSDPWLIATSDRRSGRLLLDLGRLDEALESIEEAARSDERYGHWLDAAASHSMLGRIHLIRGAPIDALRHYDAAVQAAAETDLAAPFDPLEHGALLARAGRFDEARTVLEGVLEGTSDPGRQADAWISLGTLANAEGRYDAARTLLAKAIDLAREGQSVAHEASARIALGGLEAELGQVESGRTHLERALDLLGDDGPELQRATAWYHLATVEIDGGDAAGALVAVGHSLALYDAHGHAAGRREALAVQARAYDASGSHDEADAAWRQVIDATARAGEVPATAQARVAFGESLARRGSHAEALSVATAALADLVGVDLPELRWRADALCARSLLSIGQSERALAAFDRALTTLETLRGEVHEPSVRSDYFDARASVARAAALAFLDAGEVERAFAFAETGRARGLLDAYGASAPHITPELAQARTEFRRSERRYAAALGAAGIDVVPGTGSGTEAGAGGAAVRVDLDSARSALRAARLTVERTMPVRAALGGMGAPPTVSEVANAIPARAALVEYVIDTEGSAAIVIQAGRIDGVRLPLSQAEIDALVARMRAPMERLAAGRTDVANLSFDLRAASALYAALVAPLEGLLEGVDAVVIVPDGVLWAAPFAAFISDIRKQPIDPARLYAQHSAHRYWIDDVAICLTPSAATLVASTAERTRPGIEVVFFANPTELPQGASPLPFASNEVERVAGLLDGRTLDAHSATEARFKELAPTARWLHLAVHGIADDSDPMHSRLALGRSDSDDGWLHAFEIEALEIGAEHVVLSACESAGDARSGEGILGLTRAFLAAGTSSVVATRWIAEDQAAAGLMARYYEALAAGAAPLGALAAAQRWAAHAGGREGLAYAHPFFWAGHVLVGAP